MNRSIAATIALFAMMAIASPGAAQDAASSLPKPGSDPSRLPPTAPVQPFTSPATDQEAAQCGPAGVQCGNGCCYPPYACCKNDKNSCCID